MDLLYDLIIEPDHLLVGEDGVLQHNDATLVIDHQAPLSELLGVIQVLAHVLHDASARNDRVE